jgi:sulfate/thiosulfate transport system permease protein
VAGYALPIERPIPGQTAPRVKGWRERSVLPGFPLALGITLAWLGAIVVIPLTALALRPWEIGLGGVWATLTNARVLAALRLSFGLSALAAALNAPLGLMIAWTLERYAFPGRRLLDALVDLPFALPTAVAGIALTALYAPNGPLGALAAKVGIKVAYTPLGILVALVFIGLPFVVRTVQPVLADLEAELEDAAASLGANRWQIATRVILPAIFPAVLTGFALAFARGVGEYGSVIFIAGNMPNVSEIAPLLIVIKLEEFKYADATAIAVVMLVASFAVLFLVDRLQRWSANRTGGR